MFSSEEGKSGDNLKVFSVNESLEGGSVPAFLKKLWILVDDDSTDELICWGYNGGSFHVFDQARFAREVLPQYFKHNNIASFIRQLNMYGFRKVVGVETGALKVEKDDLEFYHPFFLQNHEELLENIKRKVSPAVKVDSVRLKQEDVSKVLADVRSMKGKQDAITAKMDNLKRENEVLWREVANMRQKHLKQQQIVNKLIQFLVTLVRGNREIPTASRKRVMPLMLNDSSQLAAKQPKVSRQLSIEEKTPYTVQSPQPAERKFTPQTAVTGPIIHELVNDLVPSISPPATTIDKIPVEKVLTVPQRSNTVSRIRATPSPSPDKGVQKNVVTKASNLPSQAVEKLDVSDHLEVLQTDLDELKDLLSGQYSLDPSMLIGLFNPEAPISQLEKVADISDQGISSSTTDDPGTILGNELIQYEPQEDLSSLPLFDLGDNLMVPGLDDDDGIGLNNTPFEQLPESKGDMLDNDLMTPLMTPQTENPPKLI